MNRIGATQSSEQRKRQRNHSYGYDIYYLIIFISCIFHVLYNNQSILCLYILSPADLFTRWRIDLFSPPGSVLPVFSVRGIDLLVPRTALGGTESHVTPAALPLPICGRLRRLLLI